MKITVEECSFELSPLAESYVQESEFAFIRLPNSIGVSYCIKATKLFGKMHPREIRGKLVDPAVYGYADTYGKSVVIGVDGNAIASANFEVRKPSLQTSINNLQGYLENLQKRINRLETASYKLSYTEKCRLDEWKKERTEVLYGLGVLKIEEGKNV